MDGSNLEVFIGKELTDDVKAQLQEKLGADVAFIPNGANVMMNHMMGRWRVRYDRQNIIVSIKEG